MRDIMKSESAVSDLPNTWDRAETDNGFNRWLMCDNVSKTYIGRRCRDDRS